MHHHYLQLHQFIIIIIIVSSSSLSWSAWLLQTIMIARFAARVAGQQLRPNQNSNCATFPGTHLREIDWWSWRIKLRLICNEWITGWHNSIRKDTFQMNQVGVREAGDVCSSLVPGFPLGLSTHETICTHLSIMFSETPVRCQSLLAQQCINDHHANNKNIHAACTSG